MSIDFATHFIDMIGQWCNNSDIMIASGGKLSIINLSNTNTMFIFMQPSMETEMLKNFSEN